MSSIGKRKATTKPKSVILGPKGLRAGRKVIYKDKLLGKVVALTSTNSAIIKFDDTGKELSVSRSDLKYPPPRREAKSQKDAPSENLAKDGPSETKSERSEPITPQQFWEFYFSQPGADKISEIYPDWTSAQHAGIKYLGEKSYLGGIDRKKVVRTFETLTKGAYDTEVSGKTRKVFKDQGIDIGIRRATENESRFDDSVEESKEKSEEKSQILRYFPNQPDFRLIRAKYVILSTLFNHRELPTFDELQDATDRANKSGLAPSAPRGPSGGRKGSRSSEDVKLAFVSWNRDRYQKEENKINKVINKEGKYTFLKKAIEELTNPPESPGVQTIDIVQLRGYLTFGSGIKSQSRSIKIW
jgi:hypothetical protein